MTIDGAAYTLDNGGWPALTCLAQNRVPLDKREGCVKRHLFFAMFGCTGLVAQRFHHEIASHLGAACFAFGSVRVFSSWSSFWRRRRDHAQIYRAGGRP